MEQPCSRIHIRISDLKMIFQSVTSGSRPRIGEGTKFLCRNIGGASNIANKPLIIKCLGWRGMGYPEYFIGALFFSFFLQFLYGALGYEMVMTFDRTFIGSS